MSRETSEISYGEGIRARHAVPLLTDFAGPETKTAAVFSAEHRDIFQALFITQIGIEQFIPTHAALPVDIVNCAIGAGFHA